MEPVSSRSGPPLLRFLVKSDTVGASDERSRGAVPPRPTPLLVIPEGIPSYLKARDHWVNWRYHLKDGKWTKPPYRADGKGEASSTNPATWAPFETALSSYRSRDWDGLGYALARFPSRPQTRGFNDHIAGIDLDHCRDCATGPRLQWPRASSRRSIRTRRFPERQRDSHLRPRHATRRAAQAWEPRGYQSGRYLTCTGHHLPGTPSEIRRARPRLKSPIG